MRRWVISISAAVIALGLAVSEMGVAAARRPPAHGPLEGVPPFGHVFLIIGENTSVSQDNARNTPYLVSRLKPHAAWLTNYFANANGSLADYIAMTSGHFRRCEVNDDLPYNLNSGKLLCHEPGNNLFHQLDRAHISWIEWNESMPSPCAFIDTGVDWYSDVYSTHHNPAVYYDDIEGARYNESASGAPKAECMHRVRPTGTTAPNDMSAFNAALSSGHVARFNMVIPNDCQNGHDHCGKENPHGLFDAFLRREVPKIESSRAFGSGGVILITYDEWGDATPHNHHVAFVAVGPLVRPGVYRGGPFSHYSLLRTLEDGFRISHHIRGAAHARAINQIWK